MSRRRLLTLVCLSASIPTASLLYSRFTTLQHVLWRPQMTDGVIVVGSGLAGLAAAAELLAHEVPVLVLERSPKPGGNSIKASSGINGAPTRFQSGPEDTEFYSDTLKSAGAALSTFREHRETLISTLTNESATAVEWLVEKHGVDLSRVALLGGHSRARTHRPSGQMPVGASIVTTLLKNLNANPLFRLQTSSTVTRVLRTGSGAVTGVEYSSAERPNDDPETVHGPVLFASGGFAGDAQGLLSLYRPDLKGYPSTNTPLPGSALLLTAVGAQLLDMDLVQVHPTGFIDPADTDNPLKFLAAEVLRGEGGILLDEAGKRFVNELETREKVTNAIIENTSLDSDTKATSDSLTTQFPIHLLLDEATYAATKSHVDFYIFKGLVHKATLADLPSDFLSSVKQYSAIVASKSPDPFGRTAFGHWALAEPTPETTIYVGSVTPVVHFTMGGVQIDIQGAVTDESSLPIPGLWAAGEITGGVHGSNRLGGNSLLECVVYGRRAGKAAAEYYAKKKAER